MQRQWHDKGNIVSLGAEHTRHMQHRFHGIDIQQGLHGTLVPVIQNIVIKPRLPLFDQARQRNRGMHVRQGIVGGLVANTVGGGQFLQAKAGQPILAQGPFDAVRAQGIGGTHHIDNVPTGITVLPLPGVGIVEIAVQGIAGHFIVEAQGVIPHTTGTGQRQFRMNLANKLTLGQPLGQRLLRRYTRDQAGLWVR